MTTEDKILKTLEDIKRVTLLGVKDVLDVKDVAAITGLSVNRIQHLVNDRAIPATSRRDGTGYSSKSRRSTPGCSRGARTASPT